MHMPLRLLCVCALLAASARAASGQCQLQKLVPADAIFAQQTGESVAIDGDVAVLGAPFDDDLGHWSGSAYVYEQHGDEWVLSAKLHASDADIDDRFGFAVDVDQGVVVVGTRYNQDQGYGTGSAYVFERVRGVWTETAKLLASDAQLDQFFGQSVAVAGNVIVVGAYLDDELGFAAGAAYVFERSGATWVETQRLTASDGALDDRFGWDVAATPSLLLISAHGSDVAGPLSGAAYVFERVGSAWVERDKLVPLDPQEGARFAYSLDLSGEWALIGAPFSDVAGQPTGAAYVWRHTGGKWKQFQKLSASDGLPDDLFGEQVAIDGNLALVSAWSVDAPATNAGAAYVFRNAGLSWNHHARIAPSDVAGLDSFSKSVGLSGDTLLLGSPGDDDLQDRVGAGYMLSALGLGCPDLYAEPQVIQLALGGRQNFTLRAAGGAGDLYYMLGSTSGTAPGFSYGGFLLPLNPDPYFNVSLLNPNQPPLTASLGVLDGDGVGAAWFTLPPGMSPALSGISVDHAYGTFDSTTFQMTFASHPVPLSFL
jgi:hypothetical protein